MKTTAVIVAAGMGSRMNAGINKQFLELCGEPILLHTLRVFESHESISEIVLVLKEDEIAFVEETIIEANGLSKVTSVVKGGKERSDSVRNGLEEVKHDGVVLIHDGARPLVSNDEITDVINAVETHSAAILGTPATNTVKSVNDKGEVTDTLDRSLLWNVSTPQGFRTGLIKDAYAGDMDSAARLWDDSMLVERLGHKVSMVKGSYENIKITTPIDILIGESILLERKG